MFDYDNAIFQPCKEWIADALNAGKSWDDILTLCVSSEERESKLADLIDEFMWPEDLTLDAWEAFVADYKTTHITVIIPLKREKNIVFRRKNLFWRLSSRGLTCSVRQRTAGSIRQ